MSDMGDNSLSNLDEIRLAIQLLQMRMRILTECARSATVKE